MHIDIQARDFLLTEALESQIRRRLDFALKPRYDQIQHIHVRLSDLNGPRGGVDKCCTLHIVLPHLQDVVVNDTEFDMYIAINRAIDRAGRAVSRRLSRQRVRSQRPPRQPPIHSLPPEEAAQNNLLQV